MSETELWLMKRIDAMYTAQPFLGSRKITEDLQGEGLNINRKHVQRIMRRLGIASTPPGPHISKPHPEHVKFPYLLRGLVLSTPLEVWSSDITYIPLQQGYVYLVAII